MRASLIGLVLLGLVCGAAAPQDAPAFTPLGVNEKGQLVFRRACDGGRVVWIPAGPFHQRAYTRLESLEVPMTVRWLDGYAIDEAEVTSAQFARFLNAVGRDRDEAGHAYLVPVAQGLERVGGKWRPAPGCETLPALGVTGHGALAFARWTGGDLPEIAEWQKAAGGPEGFKFPWGNTPEPDATRANFRLGGPGAPTPVRSYPTGQSPYGCFDMAGNVSERVWTERRGGPRAPVMIRGAGWASPHPMNLRTNCLCMQPLDVGERTVGFRCVNRTGAGLPPRGVERLRLQKTWEQARDEAKARNVPLLVSLQFDTCGQCDRLKVGLFRDPAFIRYVNEHAVVAVGHRPGDAEDAPHPCGPDDACPLYPGITCLDHLVLWAELLRRVERFRISPGNFILDPRVAEDAPASQRILIQEDALPKWGGGAEVYIARLKEAQAKLGDGIPYSEWRGR